MKPILHWKCNVFPSLYGSTPAASAAAVAGIRLLRSFPTYLFCRFLYQFFFYFLASSSLFFIFVSFSLFNFSFEFFDSLDRECLLLLSSALLLLSYLLLFALCRLYFYFLFNYAHKFIMYIHTFQRSFIPPDFRTVVWLVGWLVRIFCLCMSVLSSRYNFLKLWAMRNHLECGHAISIFVLATF